MSSDMRTNDSRDELRFFIAKKIAPAGAGATSVTMQ